MSFQNVATTIVLTGAGPHVLTKPIDVISILVPVGGAVTVEKDGATFLTLGAGLSTVEFRSAAGIVVNGECTLLTRVGPLTSRTQTFILSTPPGVGYVRTTRFAEISSGTSGTITLPPEASVILDDFGGTTDAVVTTIEGGRPTYAAATDASGNLVATSFDSSGNYILTSAPAIYPVALVYRVEQDAQDYDHNSADIVGPPQIVTDKAERVTFNPAGDVAANNVQDAIEELDSEKLSQAFETVSKNLKAYPSALNYTSGTLTSIVYTLDSGSITKTFGYTGDKLTTLTLSGATPSGIQLVKTLTYTGDDLTGISYS